MAPLLHETHKRREDLLTHAEGTFARHLGVYFLAGNEHRVEDFHYLLHNWAAALATNTAASARSNAIEQARSILQVFHTLDTDIEVQEAVFPFLDTLRRISDKDSDRHIEKVLQDVARNHAMRVWPHMAYQGLNREWFHAMLVKFQAEVEPLV